MDLLQVYARIRAESSGKGSFKSRQQYKAGPGYVACQPCLSTVDHAQYSGKSCAEAHTKRKTYLKVVIHRQSNLLLLALHAKVMWTK